MPSPPSPDTVRTLESEPVPVRRPVRDRCRTPGPAANRTAPTCRMLRRSPSRLTASHTSEQPTAHAVRRRSGSDRGYANAAILRFDDGLRGVRRLGDSAGYGGHDVERTVCSAEASATGRSRHAEARLGSRRGKIRRRADERPFRVLSRADLRGALCRSEARQGTADEGSSRLRPLPRRRRGFTPSPGIAFPSGRPPADRRAANRGRPLACRKPVPSAGRR